MNQICKDLEAEYNALDAIVKDLSDDTWQLKTPFFNWTIKDEISHIAYFDRAAYYSATDQDAFQKDMEEMLDGFVDYSKMHKKVNSVGGQMPTQELLSWWRENRKKLLEAYISLSPKERLPWYGPSMSAKSSATARLMETWAHGQDIIDALKITRAATDRLRHIAHIGVNTFQWSFKNRQQTAPDKPIYVALNGPSGETWEWGPTDAENHVVGDAHDFCLVVTQRRNIADVTSVTTKGDIANQWMQIAQAFAGPPETPPQAGRRMT
jgi:uncharacterized protein (TIGR03084 family)